MSAHDIAGLPEPAAVDADGETTAAAAGACTTASRLDRSSGCPPETPHVFCTPVVREMDPVAWEPPGWEEWW